MGGRRRRRDRENAGACKREITRNFYDGTNYGHCRVDVVSQERGYDVRKVREDGIGGGTYFE